jgi:hypothetical protein
MAALATFTLGGLSFRSVRVHANLILPCREAASQAFYLSQSQIFLKLRGFPFDFEVAAVAFVADQAFIALAQLLAQVGHDGLAVVGIFAPLFLIGVTGDVLWLATGILGEVIDIGKGRLSGLEFEHPGPVSELVFLVQLRVVAGAGLPHFPQDFQPALGRVHN